MTGGGGGGGGTHPRFGYPQRGYRPILTRHRSSLVPSAKSTSGAVAVNAV